VQYNSEVTLEILPGSYVNEPEVVSWVRSAGDIAPAVERVVVSMTAACYSARDVFGMRVALEEAIVNGFKHGNQCDPGKAVRVRCRVNARRALADVEDEGSGFDPAEVPDPTRPENLERACGRGLLLMRTYLTRCRFSRRGNRVTLCKRRSTPPPHGP
jgi:serine/threonine-protein kinase RsbW